MSTPRGASAYSATRSHISLDALNFLLADVRGALGPYLNVFLVTQQGWSQSSVGVMTTIGGLIGLAAQTPAGAAIDATPAKRGAVVIALVVLAFSAVIIFAAPTFWPVLAANTAMAVVGDVFGPAVAALTLGLFARAQLASRTGRNGAFDHAGNVAIAILAGAVGWLFGQRALFLLVPLFAILAAGAALSIPVAAIDQERARGGDPSSSERDRSGWHAVLTSRALMVFALSAVLFHFANAPLLPLVGQKLALANKGLATAMMSACIIAAQLVMLPISLFAGKKAAQWGRKPLLLIGFAVLPVRALLYTLSNDARWLITVQLLDGIGAGIWGVLMPLIVADLTRGTGQYSLGLGVIATAQGIGASLSGLAAGLIVDHLGYRAAFFTAGIVALAAVALIVLALPETLQGADDFRQRGLPRSSAADVPGQPQAAPAPLVSLH
jgi:MFS family permease